MDSRGVNRGKIKGGRESKAEATIRVVLFVIGVEEIAVEAC